MHNRAMLLFHQYMLVGGMSKPVVSFVENKKDFTEADKEMILAVAVGGKCV